MATFGATTLPKPSKVYQLIDSKLMAKHFRDLGDESTAQLFRPSSMEAIRSLGGDPLTLVSEMPLFIAPGVGDLIGPPDPVAADWKRKVDAWRFQLARGQRPERIAACSRSGCLTPMPVEDQMRLQWTMIAAGIDQAGLAISPPPSPRRAI